MQYWLMKTEPGAFSYDDLEKAGKTLWDGVRNFQARNNMKAMKIGDQVLIYHSVTEKAVVGTGVISKEEFPDVTAKGEKGEWVVVEVKPGKRLKNPVTLEAIKGEPALAEIKLIKQSRLSVVPLDKKDFDKIVKMGS